MVTRFEDLYEIPSQNENQRFTIRYARFHVGNTFEKPSRFPKPRGFGRTCSGKKIMKDNPMDTHWRTDFYRSMQKSGFCAGAFSFPIPY